MFVSFPLIGKIFQPQDFENTETVIVAVSGGSDSMSLLLLVRDFLERTRIQHKSIAEIEKIPRLIAVTVDHGLRPESGKEAQQVAGFCAQLCIPHIIARWEGKKPETALAEQARHARYLLLHAMAQKYEAKVVFTGHTLDDQAETYLMRASRTKDRNPPRILRRGLAAMARQSLLLGEIRLIRPLLGVRRHHLRQFLTMREQSWIEDPSNEDERFERVRIRKSLDEATLAQAATTAKQARQRRCHHNACAVKLLTLLTPQRRGEIYQFDLSAIEAKDPDLVQLLADLAVLAGGGKYLRAPSIKLFSLMHKSSLSRFNWAGSVIEKKGTRLRMWRERRNLATMTLAPHTACIWDKRYHITNDSDSEILIRPATMEEVCRFQSSGEKLPMMALSATPAIVRGKEAELPVLNGSFAQIRQLVLKRILLPFHFLQAHEDSALIACFQQIFNFVIEFYPKMHNVTKSA